MNLIRYALFAALAATCLPDTSPAQRAGALRVGIAAETPMSDRTPIRRLDAGVEGTYSWVGAIATGLPAGIAVFTSTDPEQHGVGKRLLGSVLIAAIAALPGALIDSLFRK
ncbi:MAG: hypothetical protein AB7N73_05725 [Gemmatimonadales bacterium]